jgi:hypothetical protein
MSNKIIFKPHPQPFSHRRRERGEENKKSVFASPFPLGEGRGEANKKYSIISILKFPLRGIEGASNQSLCLRII